MNKEEKINYVKFWLQCFGDRDNQTFNKRVTEEKKKLMNNNDVFLISKGWIDPMENHTASGYKPYSYTNSEEEAKKFCESQGYWTDKDCWEIRFMHNKQMPKYKYEKISKLISNE